MDIRSKVCEIAETLFVKGGFFEYQKTVLNADNLKGVSIDLPVQIECEKTIPHKIIRTEVIDIDRETEDNSTIYITEVVAEVCYINFSDKDGIMVESGGSEGVYIEGSNNPHNVMERNFTFFIQHNTDDTFTVININY